ncbi:MAG: nucleoside deaminase [Planctomycetota bacterium]
MTRARSRWWWLTARGDDRASDSGVLDASHCTARDRVTMARALELADEAASIGEVPVGACVYETATGRIVSESGNTRERDRDPAGHAELIAMRDAAKALGDWRLDGCTLVVTLEPCPMCAGAIVNARVGRVVYGCDDPKAGACRSVLSITSDARLNHRPVVIAGLEAEACSQRLTVFFKALRARRAADRRREG